MQRCSTSYINKTVNRIATRHLFRGRFLPPPFPFLLPFFPPLLLTFSHYLPFANKPPGLIQLGNNCVSFGSNRFISRGTIAFTKQGLGGLCKLPSGVLNGPRFPIRYENFGYSHTFKADIGLLNIFMDFRDFLA